MYKLVCGLTLVLVSGVSSRLTGQELSKCENPGGRIESFSVTIPAGTARAYNNTVEAFVTTGFLPSYTSPYSNQVEWTSGEDENRFDGAVRARFIRAILFETSAGTVVNVSAHETVYATNRVRTTNDVLTNGNHGFGFKVWCGARRIAQALEEMVARTAVASTTSLREVAEKASVTPKGDREVARSE